MVNVVLGARLSLALSAVIAVLCFSLPAIAASSQAVPYQLGLQTGVTEIARGINTFHNLLLWIITIITIFVLCLLIYVLVRFNEKSNPTPSRNTHNTMLEVAWTVIPIIILVLIAVPSFRLLYAQYTFPKPDVVIKATGSQWYWDYEYPDEEGVTFSANMISDEDVLKTELGDASFDSQFGSLEGVALQKALYAAAAPLWPKLNMVRQLSTDNDLVVPVNAVVHVIVTASDVIHNWTIPAFGSKVDAVPGRTTSTWFKAEVTGTYYGQCSELCGIRHAFMPITVRVVERAVYDRWLTALKAGDDDQVKKIIQDAMAAGNTGKVALLNAQANN